MKTGGHIKPCKVGSVEEHNGRDQAYVERMNTSKHPLNFYPELALHPNQNWKDTEREEYRDKTTREPLKVAQVFNRMIEVYTEHDKRHRRPPLKDTERFDPKTGKMKTVAGWSPIREMVVVIKPDTKLQDFDKVKAWFAQNSVGTMFLSLHFDEGHLDEQGNLKANNHAHMGLDFFNWETGKTIKLGPAKMKELQTVLADALGMERGEIKETTGKEHLDVVDQRIHAKMQKEKEIDKRIVGKQQYLDVLDEKVSAKKMVTAAKEKALGIFGQSSKDKTIQQLQDIIAKEPERTAAAVATAKAEERQQVISEIKQAAKLHIGKDGNETAEQIGNAWRRNYDKVRSLEVDMQSKDAEHAAAIYRATKDAEHKAEEAQKEATLWKNRFAGIWPTAVKAIAAIVEKVNSSWQKLFTAQQVKDIDAAMHSAHNINERIIYGKDLMKYARPEFTRAENDTAKQVEDIARNGLNVQKINTGVSY